MEDTTVVTKHSEIRPSAEMGPIICCLDTSGSMHGMRSTVAKVGANFTIGNIVHWRGERAGVQVQKTCTRDNRLARRPVVD